MHGINQNLAQIIMHRISQNLMQGSDAQNKLKFGTRNNAQNKKLTKNEMHRKK